MKTLYINAWVFTLLTALCFVYAFYIYVISNDIVLLNQTWRDFTLFIMSLTFMLWSSILLARLRIINARTYSRFCLDSFLFLGNIFVGGLIAKIWLAEFAVTINFIGVIVFGIIWVSLNLYVNRKRSFDESRFKTQNRS
jgi:hypothetical protein